MLSDVRNAVSIEEGYCAENQEYKAFGPVTGNGGTTSFELVPGTVIRLSNNVTLTGTLDVDGSLSITGNHPGSTNTITYSTVVGLRR